MTDKPQELDEILDGFARAVRVVVVNGLSHDKYERRQKDFKQAIIDWHNKQVDEVLDRAKQRFHEPIEHDGSYISISVIDKTFDELIQAERKKLKEVK